MIDIEIQSTGERLLMSYKNRLRVTFQSCDLRESGTAKSSFSTSVNLPLTNENIEKLGFKTVQNILNSETTIIRARLISDNNELDKGFIRINKDSDKSKEIELTFFGRSVDWFSQLKGKEIRDVDLSMYDHLNTIANIIEARTEGYIYLPVNYGGVSDRATAQIYSNEIFPAIFVKDLIKHIFKDIGYKVAGTLFDRPELARMLIPYNGGVPLHSNEWVTLHSARITGEGTNVINANLLYKVKAQPINTSATKVLFNRSGITDTAFPLGGDYNLSDASYTATEPMEVNVTFFINEQHNTFFPEEQMQVVLYKNGVAVQTTGYYTGDRLFTFNTLQLTTGDKLELYANILTGTYEKSIVMSIHDSNFYSNSPDFAKPISWWAITPTKTIAVNSPYQLSWFLPKMKQSEFMEYILFIFNCLVSFDAKTNSIIIDTVNDINISNSEDWSSKLDLSAPIERNFIDLVSNYSKQNVCLYEREKDDELTEAYFNDQGIEYGQGSIEIANEYLEDSSEYYKAPFLPAPSIKVFTGVSNLQLWLPSLFRKDNGTAYIVYYMPNVNISDLTKGVISTISIDSTPITEIPYSFFANPINYINDGLTNDHLAFDLPTDYPFQGNGILDKNYKKIESILNNAETVNASLFLTTLEISNIDFTKLKYIEALGGYYYLNKIGQYDASGDSTECELIKWN